MYKILIVDDEKWVRKGIISKLNISGLEFSWTGEASNGQEALSIIAREKPEIVIADIRMPIMDGISFIRETKRLYPETKLIIISGFNEFEYAQQAINMGVNGYLLKPVDTAEITETINKVISELEYHNRIVMMNDVKNSLEKQSNLLLLENTLNKVFHSPEPPDYESITLANELTGFNHNIVYILAVIHIDQCNRENIGRLYQNINSMKFALMKQLKEAIQEQGFFVINDQSDPAKILILYANKTGISQNRMFAKLLKDLHNKINNDLNISVTVGVSSEAGTINAELYRQAKAAYSNRLISGTNKIYNYIGDEDADHSISVHQERIRMLQKCLQSCDLRNLKPIFEHIFLKENLKGLPVFYIHYLYSEAVNAFLKTCSEKEIRLDRYVVSNLMSGTRLDYIDDCSEIVDYLYETMVEALSKKSEMLGDCKGTVRSIRKFIENNYHNELLVKGIAKEFNLNPNYLSGIFKKEVGDSLISYLTKVRLEKTCQLLKETDMSIFEIGQSVGYKNPEYFYKVFKKEIGITALDYRNKRNCG